LSPVETLAAVFRRVVMVAILVAALSALVGFFVAHFAHLGGAAQGAGWGMCVVGALIALVTGQSGSPSRMAVEGRSGAFGQFWGRNPALPQSPLLFLGSSVLVFAGGIAVIVLTY
jgi:hypothetical protein